MFTKHLLLFTNKFTESIAIFIGPIGSRMARVDQLSATDLRNQYFPFRPVRVGHRDFHSVSQVPEPMIRSFYVGTSYPEVLNKVLSCRVM